MNEYLYWSVIVAWFIAQTTKLLIGSLRSQSFQPGQFCRTGGLPSGHATIAIGILTAVALDQGVTPLFYVTLAFGAIVIHDAMAPRITRRHTPFQVASGIILGVGIVLLAYIVF